MAVLLAGLSFALLCSLPAPARARRKIIYKVARFLEDKNTVYMSVKFPKLITSKLKRKLKSGFTQTVVLHATLYDYLTRRKKSVSLWTCTAVYDLWEDHFTIKVADPDKRKTYREKRLTGAIKRVTTVKKLPIVSTAKVPTWRYFFVAVTVRYNPVSKRLLRKVRKWLRKPRGGPRTLMRIQSFFGSSLSFFINPRISPAERSLRFRTQNFFRTEK